MAADQYAIEEIWRYPVKSLRGERVTHSRADRRGLLGDRLWAVRDTGSGKIGSGKNTTRFRRFPGPALLELSSRYPAPFAEAPGTPPLLTTADGRDHPVGDGSADALLRRLTGIATLTVAAESDVDHFDEVPLSLIGTATLRWVAARLGGAAVDARRFRPNLVIRTEEPFAEEALLGRPVRIGAGGEAVLAVFDRVIERCVMTSAAQGPLPPAPGMLKLLARRPGHPLRLAVGGHVTRPGLIRVGESVAG